MPLSRNVSIRNLATFQAVVRSGSLTLAAEEMHLSQSAVSIQITNLEESIGTLLILRTGRGTKLTDAGMMLLDYANRLLCLWHEASEELESFSGSFSGTLRLGAVSTSEYWLPLLLVKFANANPKVKVKLQIANRDEIMRKLMAQDIDTAVIGQPPKDIKVQAQAFAHNPMAFMTSANHMLQSVVDLNFSKVADYPLLVREQGSGSRATLESLFIESGMRLRISSELSSNESIKQMCAAGFGVAFLSVQTCLLEMKAGLLKPLLFEGNPVMRTWFTSHMSSQQPTEVAQSFEQYLLDHGQACIDQQTQQLQALPV